MTITYSGRSAISADLIADEDDDIFTNRGPTGDINWGRATADTRLNPDISNVTNKRVMRELFAEHEVPAPKLYGEEEVCNTYVGGESLPVLVGRPDYHSKGRGFWLVDDITSLNKALRGTRKKKPATHFMEYIDAPREYRVHIFLGKSIRISEKLYNEDRSDYTTIKPTHGIKHVRRAAKKALAAVALDFGAVDILSKGNKAYVLEVNAAPGLGGSMPEVYARVFKQWYEGEWE